MVVAPKRVAAVQMLLSKNKNCNVVLSDDGLQHLALARDLEIAVIDSKRRCGNGFCLPAGPLREPSQRLYQVDFIISNGAANAGEYAMQLIPGSIYNLLQPHLTLALNAIRNRNIHAVAAIGNPMRFFTLLKQLGFNIIEHPFPDHYFFQKNDLEFGSDAIVIMTEKDAVKYQRYADERFWCLPIQAELSPDFAPALLQKISQLKPQK